MFGLVSGIRRHLDDEHAVPVGRLDVREKRKNINGEKIKHDKKKEFQFFNQFKIHCRNVSFGLPSLDSKMSFCNFPHSFSQSYSRRNAVRLSPKRIREKSRS